MCSGKTIFHQFFYYYYYIPLSLWRSSSFYQCCKKIFYFKETETVRWRCAPVISFWLAERNTQLARRPLRCVVPHTDVDVPTECGTRCARAKSWLENQLSRLKAVIGFAGHKNQPQLEW